MTKVANLIGAGIAGAMLGAAIVGGWGFHYAGKKTTEGVEAARTAAQIAFIRGACDGSACDLEIVHEGSQEDTLYRVANGVAILNGEVAMLPSACTRIPADPYDTMRGQCRIIRPGPDTPAYN